MMKKIIFFIFLYSLIYSLPRGGELLYIPYGLSGGSFSSGLNSDSTGNLFVNPATASSFDGLSFFSGYLFVKDFPSFIGGIGLPFFDYKISIATKIAGNHNLESYGNAGSYYSGVIGFSRRIANNFLFGINFNFSYLLKNEFSDISYTFDSGFLYKFLDLFSGEGFSIKDTFFEFTIYGIGKQAIYEDRSGIPPLGIRSGIKTCFFNSRFIDFSIGTELNYNFLIEEFYQSIFLGTHFLNNFGLSAAYIFGNKNIGNLTNGYFPFSFLISYKNIIGNVPFSIYYSLNQINFNVKNELIHFVGFEFNFNEISPDDKIELSIGEKKEKIYHFSPNFDKEKDSVIFNINTTTNKPVEHWELIIKEKNGKIVRKYRDKNEDEYNILKLFSKIFSKKEYIPIPKHIEWDGIYDNGSIMPEGKYESFFIIINGSRTNYSDTNHIYLDITPPYGTLSLDDIYFSPNGDNYKDSLIIYPSLSSDRWTMKVINKNGDIFYSSEISTNTKIEWDGKDEKGNIAQKGLYDIIFFGEDKAGNKNILYVNDLLLSTDKYIVYPEFQKEISFSLNSNLVINLVSIPDDIKILKYKVIISKDNKIIRIFEGREKNEIIWDGKDVNGKIVSDGKYFIEANVEFENGEKAKSERYSLLVDSTPPVVKLKMENMPFSPDGDGENDILKINIQLDDFVGLENGKLTIYDPDKRVFKQFDIKDKRQILWDGRSDNGELVESAQDYLCEVEAIDKIGNSSKKIISKIETDILVEKIDRGYKIKINNIEFEFNKYDILPKSLPILKRLTQILKKYPDYFIEIHGHTDNIGSEKYNLKLSEQRANSVYEFLKKEGISNKMKIRGFGFKHPISDNSTEEGRRKNRRVEFILKK